MNFQEIHNQASIEANKAFEAQQDYGMGSCGYALVSLCDNRQTFTKWAQVKFKCQPKHVRVSPLNATNLPLDCYTQSIDKKEAWCNTYAMILREHGVKCEVKSALL